MVDKNRQVVVAAFYKFVAMPDFAGQRGPLLALCRDNGLLGTILLAPEGVNGTVAGQCHSIKVLLQHLRELPGFSDLEHKESLAAENPFYRMKVRLKREIVAMGVDGINPNENAGIHVSPTDWNDLITDPDVVVIDSRNDYEVAIGSFAGAIDPKTPTFRDFPKWFRANREAYSDKKFAMYCTGGIRCEKSTAFLKSEGVAEVYHLKGGILKYLEEVPEGKSLWRGECFVFDLRVSVTHGLAQGNFGLCHACRLPVSVADRASKKYIEGIACPHCYDSKNESQRARFVERQRQIELAVARGEKHLGPST